MGLTKAGGVGNPRIDVPMDQPQGGVCVPGDMKADRTEASKTESGELGINVNAGVELGGVVKGSHTADGKVDIKTDDVFSSGGVSEADPDAILAALRNPAMVCTESTAAARKVSAEVGVGLTMKMVGEVSAAAEAIGGVTASHGEIKTRSDEDGAATASSIEQN